MFLSWLKQRLGVAPAAPRELKHPLPSLEEATQVLAQLRRMHKLMGDEGKSWKGVDQAAAHLAKGISNPEDLDVSWGRACDTFGSMWGGMGSLSEFYIDSSTVEGEALSDEYDELSRALQLRLC